ncbi:MAG: HEAT repeat domain-containing protein [Planctomycetes bacterium]|nr:HEAT repeat domain-containing protein [Planctomycetota bacterium]
MPARFLLLVFLACLLPGCARDSGASAGAALPRQEELLERYWSLYRARDPAWPEARDRWYALGGRARERLVLTLVQELVRKAHVPERGAEGDVPGWKRPQEDLLALGSEGTVPVLVEALRVGRDAVSLDPLADALAGHGAVGALLDALDHPRPDDSRLFPRYALRVLVKAGGASAIERAGAELRAHADWEVRAAAAGALGSARYSDGQRAVEALLPGLSDQDPFVVEKTLDSLVRLARPQAAPRIAAHLEEARRRGDGAQAAAAAAALRRLTGTSVSGDDPELWQRAAEEAAARSRREQGP